MKALDTLRGRLVTAQADALRVYEADKTQGAGVESVAFASGRYDGLKQALEVLDDFAGEHGL